jgi:ankyrin repeat protein
VQPAIVAAAEDGHLEVVALVIDEGADVNVRDSYDKSALDRARKGGYEDITQMLIVQGPKPTRAGTRPVSDALRTV